MKSPLSEWDLLFLRLVYPSNEIQQKDTKSVLYLFMMIAIMRSTRKKNMLKEHLSCMYPL